VKHSIAQVYEHSASRGPSTVAELFVYTVVQKRPLYMTLVYTNVDRFL